MNKSRHTPEQIVGQLREVETNLASEASIPEIANEREISEAAFHRWRNRYASIGRAQPV